MGKVIRATPIAVQPAFVANSSAEQFCHYLEKMVAFLARVVVTKAHADDPVRLLHTEAGSRFHSIQVPAQAKMR
jgi:hypothetical protein